jgi:hypothetical protein
MVNTSLALRNPYVLETPIGSQITQRKKSSIIRPTASLKMAEYIRGGR